MIRKPSHEEWNTSGLPADGRDYLDLGLSFEEIAAQIGGESQIVCARIEPYRDRPSSVPRDVRQIIFVIRVSQQACDQFYNAPDGLRGRYWQSPDHGLVATRYLIGKLMPELLSFVEQNPPRPPKKISRMTSEEIQASLQAPSAKFWPREKDATGELLLAGEDAGLVVPRWAQNEQYGEQKGMWRKSLTGDELEIKGALLDPNGTEHVPDGKRDRSCQLYRFGFT
jgi:hypothetical protein